MISERQDRACQPGANKDHHGHKMDGEGCVISMQSVLGVYFCLGKLDQRLAVVGGRYSVLRTL